MDVSKKYGMDYRLLHAITKNNSWYSEWGYGFGSGSYGLTRDSYESSIKALSSVPLRSLLFQGRRPRSQIQSVISFYRSLSEEAELLTLKDLFSFLMKLAQSLHKPLLPKKPWCTGVGPGVLCAWTGEDVGSVQKDMMKVLLAAAMADDRTWVSRSSLKAALCKTASFELLDFCLKHLPGRVAGGGLVVESRCCPLSSFVEFRLQPSTSRPDSSFLTEELIIRDLKILYDAVLHPQTMSAYTPTAARRLIFSYSSTILDCKHFSKNYTPVSPSSARIWCEAQLSEFSTDDPLPPPELLSLPPAATVSDLKQAATTAFQSTYPVYKRFQAEELLGYGRVDDSMTLTILVGSGSDATVRVRGRCTGMQSLSRFRMERGTEIWTVDCICGTVDDDGERMLACDSCGVWLHTRCAGIGSADAIPAKFVCRRCIRSVSEQSAAADIATDSPPGGCRGAALVFASAADLEKF